MSVSIRLAGGCVSRLPAAQALRKQAPTCDARCRVDLSTRLSPVPAISYL